MMDAVSIKSSMKPQLTTIYDYEPLVGSETVERIAKRAEQLRDLHIVNISSTYYGGGVAELLSSLTLLINVSGIRTGWRVIQGRPDFFSVTKKMHNALQGAEINLTEQKRATYEEVVFENALRMHLDHDLVIVHDPQPLPLIRHFRKKAPWIWLSCRPFVSQSGALGLPCTFHRKLRCRRNVVAGIWPEAERATAVHHAGDQSLFDNEQGVVAGRDRGAAHALRNSD